MLEFGIKFIKQYYIRYVIIMSHRIVSKSICDVIGDDTVLTSVGDDTVLTSVYYHRESSCFFRDI